MIMEEGLFITLEGGDGGGKSTHLDWLASYFENLGEKVIVTREPGGTELSEMIRELLLNQDMSLLTEALLFAASRNEHLIKTIKPNLDKGIVVISDRYMDSSHAYQCGGRGLDENVFYGLCKMIDVITPDLTLLFDLDPDIAQARMGSRTLDRFELEKAEFHISVRNKYLEIAAKPENKYRFKLIDSSKTIEAIREDLKKIVYEVMKDGY